MDQAECIHPFGGRIAEDVRPLQKTHPHHQVHIPILVEANMRIGDAYASFNTLVLIFDRFVDVDLDPFARAAQGGQVGTGPDVRSIIRPECHHPGFVAGVVAELLAFGQEVLFVIYGGSHGPLDRKFLAPVIQNGPIVLGQVHLRQG